METYSAPGTAALVRVSDSVVPIGIIAASLLGYDLKSSIGRCPDPPSAARAALS
jgi:hypothetical protein